MDGMRVTYDHDARAIYFTLRELAEGEHAARTVQVGGDESTMADLDADGRLIGIEVLSPGRHWPLHRILREYEIGDEDAMMLMAGYPHAWSAGVAWVP